MIRLAGVVLLVGCASSPPPTCSLDEEIAAQLTVPATSCGFVLPGSPLEAYTAAHDCAARAIHDGTPFIVHWAVQLIDYGEGSFAYVGTSEHGIYVVRRFAEGSGEELYSTYTTAATCSQVVDRDACAEIYDTLCLACSDTAERVCP